MKRIIAILASVVLVASLSVANAQKKDFDPYWFLQLQAGAAETIGETNWTDLLSPAAAASLGYQFSPVFAARLNVNGWQGKGAINTGSAQVYKYNFVEGAVDLMADLASLFAGYKFDRTINVIDNNGIFRIGYLCRLFNKLKNSRCTSKCVLQFCDNSRNFVKRLCILICVAQETR